MMKQYKYKLSGIHKKTNKETKCEVKAYSNKQAKFLAKLENPSCKDWKVFSKK